MNVFILQVTNTSLNREEADVIEVFSTLELANVRLERLDLKEGFNQGIDRPPGFGKIVNIYEIEIDDKL